MESIQYDMEWWLDIFTRSGNGFVCGDEVEPNGWKDKGEYDKRKTTNLSIVARIKMNEKGLKMDQRKFKGKAHFLDSSSI